MVELEIRETVAKPFAQRGAGLRRRVRTRQRRRFAREYFSPFAPIGRNKGPKVPRTGA